MNGKPVSRSGLRTERGRPATACVLTARARIRSSRLIFSNGQKRRRLKPGTSQAQEQADMRDAWQEEGAAAGVPHSLPNSTPSAERAERHEDLPSSLQPDNTTESPMRQQGMTRKQAELLAYIRAYARESGGTAPLYREMQEALGLSSKSSVHRLVCSLEKKGIVIRHKHLRRSVIALADNPFVAVTDAMELLCRAVGPRLTTTFVEGLLSQIPKGKGTMA